MGIKIMRETHRKSPLANQIWAHRCARIEIISMGHEK